MIDSGRRNDDKDDDENDDENDEKKIQELRANGEEKRCWELLNSVHYINSRKFTEEKKIIK